MRSTLVTLAAAACLLVAGCSQPLTPSEQFGVDRVAQPARERMKTDAGLDIQQACRDEVDSLAPGKLAHFNDHGKDLKKDEIVEGCLLGDSDR